MRIAIVNDMVMAREVLKRVVATVPEYETAWVANDGEEAVKKCAMDRPDLILMDLIMPVMDGAEATRQIMAETPCVILVVTATVDGNSGKVFEAMGHGALDAVNTPVIGSDGNVAGAEELLEKIHRLERLVKIQSFIKPPPPKEETATPPPTTAPKLVVLGASTGGPNVLATILSKLSVEFNGAVVVVQHVDKQFAPGMATWLGGQCPFPTRLAKPGDHPERRTVLLSGTNDHLVMRRDRSLVYSEDPKELPFRPSVDVFFESVAEHWPRPGTAILLTGMGNDGARGLLALRRAGWKTIAQSKESCVVYGMPKAAAEIGAAQKHLSPHEIIDNINQLRES